MVWLPTPVRTSSEATASAHWQSGLTTTSSSESHATAWMDTTHSVQSGEGRSKPKGAAGKKVAEYGTEGRSFQAVTPKSLTKTVPCPFKTWPTRHPEQQKTSCSHMPMKTSIKFPNVSAYAGNPPKQSHLAQKCHTWASFGTCTTEWYIYVKRKSLSTSPRLQSGNRGRSTTSLRFKNCTANFCMQRWSSLQDKLTSPPWRPCSPPATTVLSFHAHRLETPQVTWNGGRQGSANQPFRRPSPSLNHSSITKLTQMRAPVLESQSQLVQDGEHGGSLTDGGPKDGTSSRPKPLASNFLSSAYAQYLKKGNTLRFSGTIRESSKDGGKDPAATCQLTRFSATSYSYLKNTIEPSTQDTSQLSRTPQTLLRGAATLPQISYSRPSQCCQNSNLSSSTRTHNNLARDAAIKGLTRKREPGEKQINSQPRIPKCRKTNESRPRNLPIPSSSDAALSRPAPYPQNLTPIPSVLQPHCLAKDLLRMWEPANTHPSPHNDLAISTIEQNRVKDTMVHAWEEDTCATYGTGLLIWHCFCD